MDGGNGLARHNMQYLTKQLRLQTTVELTHSGGWLDKLTCHDLLNSWQAEWNTQEN